MFIADNCMVVPFSLFTQMFIGGVPYFNQEGISIKYNFIGCVENVNMFGARLIRNALAGGQTSISLINNVNQFCNVSNLPGLRVKTINGTA